MPRLVCSLLMMLMSNLNSNLCVCRCSEYSALEVLVAFYCLLLFASNVSCERARVLIYILIYTSISTVRLCVCVQRACNLWIHTCYRVTFLLPLIAYRGLGNSINKTQIHAKVLFRCESTVRIVFWRYFSPSSDSRRTRHAYFGNRIEIDSVSTKEPSIISRRCVSEWQCGFLMQINYSRIYGHSHSQSSKFVSDVPILRLRSKLRSSPPF